MKKTILALLFSFYFLILIFSFQKESKNFIIKDKLKLANTNEINRIIKEAEKGYKKVVEILKLKKSNRKIKINIVNSGICKTTNNGEILLPIYYIKNKKANIIHEVTHILSKHKSNRFYAEGLAIFFQEKYGEDNGFPNFEGFDIKNQVRKYKSNLYSLKYLNSNNDIFRKWETKERMIAYIQAGSFIIFLYEKYGKNKFVELHSLNRINFKKVYNKSIDALEKEWLLYIK